MAWRDDAVQASAVREYERTALATRKIDATKAALAGKVSEILRTVTVEPSEVKIAEDGQFLLLIGAPPLSTFLFTFTDPSDHSSLALVNACRFCGASLISPVAEIADIGDIIRHGYSEHENCPSAPKPPESAS